MVSGKNKVNTSHYTIYANLYSSFEPDAVKDSSRDDSSDFPTAAVPRLQKRNNYYPIYVGILYVAYAAYFHSWREKMSVAERLVGRLAVSRLSRLCRPLIVTIVK